MNLSARMKRSYRGSFADALGQRLAALDIINRGMLFAGVLLVCFIPFMIVAQSVAGRDAASNLVRRFGLTGEAANAVGQVIASPSATSSAVSGLSWVFFLLSGFAGATAVQELYERAFDVEEQGLRTVPYRLAWLLAIVGAGGLVEWAQPELDAVGGPVLIGLVAFVGATAFWWLSMWLLLARKLTWRELFPSALATGVCWLGMTIVFRLTMSDTMTSNYEKYGSIGVIFALMSFLIAIGVVIILGAVVGTVWRERHSAPASP